jgi:hypothetical protein
MAEKTSARVNLVLPLELAILIDKECERLSITQAQFIRGAAHEKIKRIEEGSSPEKFEILERKIDELKELMNLLVKLLSK